VAGCGGPDRSAYVHSNERLFRQLPVFPGSKLDTEISTAARKEEDGPVVGYTTRFEVRLPAAATGDQVASFYERRLRPSWRLVERLDGPVLNFRRGRSFVSVNLENWRTHVLELAVDHAGG
jgi:hypothetical protein